uniref:ALK and LTK ligand 2 n=1 Tax=Equus asinus TaxID=9793 RepID=A0A8C4MXA2_EQUAS
MRGPGRPLLLGLLLVLGAAGPGRGVAEPREAADGQALLRLIVEIVQELRKYHSGESKRLQLWGPQDYALGRREVADYGADPEEQRAEIVPRDLRMKDKFLKHLTGPLYFSPKCSKHFHRLYHNTRDCTIPACKSQRLSCFKNTSTGWPRGVAVKFMCSASAAWGLQVQIPGTDLAPLVKPCCGGIPHRMEDWHRCQLGDSLPHTHTRNTSPVMMRFTCPSP